ncbi:hypothetical protein B7486_15980 [cyanobacterium TDX16]|nr:hypothetical protein B7486_15980 [cyanobacterium TDX16]
MGATMSARWRMAVQDSAQDGNVLGVLINSTKIRGAFYLSTRSPLLDLRRQDFPKEGLAVHVSRLIVRSVNHPQGRGHGASINE